MLGHKGSTRCQHTQPAADGGCPGTPTAEEADAGKLVQFEKTEASF
jgi:hypothetical protein